MAWDHLSITKPHLVYIILGGFTSLFMLCSSVIKERLYIGEATVATICGIIFGPHAAGLIDPNSWGNVDLITLEFSRIVLVVQCFAVGVELPKAYMERHWRSVTFLLIPVMTFGWLMTSLFIWWLFKSHLNWLDSLCIAACVTATDPVLASSVVGKGKFAKRVPKHLRDLLSAESGCNDGMAFPFIYLALYLIRYRPDAGKVAYHWICFTVLYECVFGAVYGVCVGYAARRAIRYAHEKDLIDRESFLVFYFVLALFCAGSGSLLGTDDLLVGFAAGVGFSNDGWFLEKTEESHVSNVIDLLINLAFFVYFGTIIPWAQYNSDILGIAAWKLVVLGILVIFFRRIPIMLALKPLIPDIKTWREALFAGHFGPIGVGGLFVAILARAELETDSTTPLAQIPEEGFEHLNIIEMIWPITTFLVIVSIVIHGSSVAVFTLGKHINTLQLTFSYTQANEEGPSWMERLPRIQSRSKSQLSSRRPDDTDASDMDEKSEYPPGTLGPLGVAGNFLRRQREDEPTSRSSSLRPSARRRRWDAGLGPGGPISQSAIAPLRLRDSSDKPDSRRDSDTLAGGSSNPSQESHTHREKQAAKLADKEEIYQEGDKTVIEDEEGNVLEVRDTQGEGERERTENDIEEAANLERKEAAKHRQSETKTKERSPHRSAEGDEEEKQNPNESAEPFRPKWRKRVGTWTGRHEDEERVEKPKPTQPKRGAARAYQFGNTIIVEDEDGEVLKKYDIPASKRVPAGPERQNTFIDQRTRQALTKMGSYLGMGPIGHHAEEESGPSGQKKRPGEHGSDDDDDHIRFTISAGGRRMSKAEFIQQIQSLDPKARAELVEESTVPEHIKEQAWQEAKEHEDEQNERRRRRADTAESTSHPKKASPKGPSYQSSSDELEEGEVPFHSVSSDLAQDRRETAAQRRRRRASLTGAAEDQSRKDVPDEISETHSRKLVSHMDEGETAAERRRRLGALGVGDDSETDDDDEVGGGLGMRELPPERSRAERGKEKQDKETAASKTAPNKPGIRFAPDTRASGSASGTQSTGLRWGSNVRGGEK